MGSPCSFTRQQALKMGYFYWLCVKNPNHLHTLKKKKSLIVEHDFFLENSSVLGVFWPRRGLQANHGTDQKSAYTQPVKIPHFKSLLARKRAVTPFFYCIFLMFIS